MHYFEHIMLLLVVFNFLFKHSCLQFQLFVSVSVNFKLISFTFGNFIGAYLEGHDLIVDFLIAVASPLLKQWENSLSFEFCNEFCLDRFFFCPINHLIDKLQKSNSHGWVFVSQTLNKCLINFCVWNASPSNGCLVNVLEAISHVVGHSEENSNALPLNEFIDWSQLEKLLEILPSLLLYVLYTWTIHQNSGEHTTTYVNDFEIVCLLALLDKLHNLFNTIQSDKLRHKIIKLWPQIIRYSFQFMYSFFLFFFTNWLLLSSCFPLLLLSNHLSSILNELYRLTCLLN